jgi:exopolysaccharide biosynthesis polyprenyl glycosylphosphotransferase
MANMDIMLLMGWGGVRQLRLTLLGKITGDAILINLGYLAAFYIRFGGRPPEFNLEAYIAAAPWITLAALLLFYSYGLYSPGRHRWEEVFSAVIASAALLFLTAITLSYMMTLFAFPRLVFLISLPVQLTLLLLWRRFVWMWSSKRLGPLRVLIVGPVLRAKERSEQLKQSDQHLYEIAGMVVDVPVIFGINKESEFPMWGPYSQIADAIENVSVNGILFCQDIPSETRIALVSEAVSKGLSVYVIPEIYELVLSNSRLEQLDGIPVFRLKSTAVKAEFAWGRLADIILSIVFFIPSVPLLLLAAFALKIETPGAPVFFLQDRVGQGGRIFKLFKLRTMVNNAEKATGPVLAVQNDSRITRVGRILRATRIDELPQLYNVLKGDMSFIGPRPERPFFVEQFRSSVPGYDYRHQMKTGITGLAQIEGKYSTSAEDKLRFDLFYAKVKSPIKDLQILLHTIKVMLMRSKSM